MIGLFVLVMVIAVVIARRTHAQRRLDGRRQALADEVADVADLVLVVLGAGGTVAHAIEILADRGPPASADVFAAVRIRAAQGEPLATAIAAEGRDLGNDHAPLVAALVAAERDGVPLGSLMLRLGEEGRRSRRVRQERIARTLPVRVLLPLIVCSLPAVVVVAIVPLVLVALGRLDL